MFDKAAWTYVKIAQLFNKRLHAGRREPYPSGAAQAKASLHGVQA